MELVFYNAETDLIQLFNPSIKVEEWYKKDGSLKHFELSVGFDFRRMETPWFFIGLV